MLGHLREGYRYTKLALSLADKFKSTEVIAEVIWVSVHIMSYIEPYSVVKAEVKKGLQASMSTGNIHLACVYSSIYCFTMFWFGVKLKDLKDQLDDFANFMQEHMHQTTLSRVKIYRHYVCKLMDGDGQPGRNSEVDLTLIEMHPFTLIFL